MTDLAAIRARRAAIDDSAYWVIERDDYPYQSNWELTGLNADQDAEPLGTLTFKDVAEFVVHAFTDILALLDEIERLQGIVVDLDNRTADPPAGSS